MYNSKTGPLPESSWPESIRKLKPKQVFVDQGDYVEIIISTGGISTRASYIIFANQNTAGKFSMPEVALHKTAYPAVFKLY
ncbi:MAG: hypothetical protein WC003_16375 [Terrimicrobiaceae bacterium]